MAHKMLQDNLTYRSLQGDPTKTIASEKHLPEGVAIGAMTPKIAEYLHNKCPVIPIFHGLPKMHKCSPLRSDPSSQGLGLCVRVWVTGWTHTCNLWFSPDQVFSVIVNLHNFTWRDSYVWVTLDVVNLYSCIPHDFARVAVDYMLHKYSSYPKEFCPFLIMSIQFLLRHNYFSFNKQFFLQTPRAPMGSEFSPSLANVFMSYWEELCFLIWWIGGGVWALHR